MIGISAGGAATLELVTVDGVVIVSEGAGAIAAGAVSVAEVALLASGNGGNYSSGEQTGTTKGKLTGKPDGLTADERKMIEDLLSSGKDVEIIPRSNIQRGKTPDFYVDGIKTEFKTLNGTSQNTPVTRITE